MAALGDLYGILCRAGRPALSMRLGRFAQTAQLYYSSDMNMIRPKRRLTVGAREANQRFSQFLREVELGNEVVITRNGRPVARLIPAEVPVDDKTKQRDLAKLLKLLKKGAPLPGGRRFSRDEMHER